ncbi:unnamed protein product [Rotaria sp. Silwood2]|nr:unnamed protein product [Rotaria sp. Silwood2]
MYIFDHVLSERIHLFFFFKANGKDPNNINNTNSMTSSKDSLIASNTDKDLKKRLNGTQFGIYGNNPSMMKFIGK